MVERSSLLEDVLENGEYLEGYDTQSSHFYTHEYLYEGRRYRVCFGVGFEFEDIIEV